MWHVIQSLGKKHQKRFSAYRFVPRGGLSSPHVRYVTDADLIFNNPLAGCVSLEDFDALCGSASEIFQRIYGARVALEGEELLDEELSDLQVVRQVVSKGCDVVTLMGLLQLRDGWCVPVDLSLQRGESKMSKERRVDRLLGNLEKLDFAKVVSRIRAILPKTIKACFADDWNSSGGPWRFLLKQIELVKQMPEGRRDAYLRALSW